MKTLDATYWESRYQSSETGWDLGEVSPPLKAYIDQLSDKSLKICVPGVGRGHEVRYLWNNGFKNVYAVDLAASPLLELQKAIPDFPVAQCIEGDFFKLNMQFDLILEQTFFCALNPDLRDAYVKKMAELLDENAKLVGLLFDFPLDENGPPFGGSQAEYHERFSPYFDIECLDRCYNSATPRQGKERFIKLRKKV